MVDDGEFLDEPSASVADPAFLVMTSPGEGDEGGMVETIGLRDRGLPELVMTGVQPEPLLAAAADLVRAVGEYMMSGRASVASGQTLLLGPQVLVRVQRTEPGDDGAERWEVVSVPGVHCALCEGGDHELWPLEEDEPWPADRVLH